MFHLSDVTCDGFVLLRGRQRYANSPIGSFLCQVNDVRLITDNKTRRSKGIAYIEFKDTESVQLALALTGQSLLGVPILVQPSQAEKNRMSMGPSMLANSRPMSSGPMRLYIGSLHFNITEDMLKGIFEPFGKVWRVGCGAIVTYRLQIFHGVTLACVALSDIRRWTCYCVLDGDIVLLVVSSVG